MTFPVLPASNPSGYNLNRSLRLRASASAYLNRTPSSTSGNQQWTYSFWVKRGLLGSNQHLLVANNTSGGLQTYIRFTSDAIDVFEYNSTGGTYVWQLQSSSVYRDPSSWYHIVVTVDTTQSTSSNRVKIWVNNVQLSAFAVSTYPTLNSTTTFNSNVASYIGTYIASSGYFDGYLTEINSISGQALTPTSFGAFNAVTGVWQPIKYSGTYGTNGFYLNFNNNASTTTLGYDTSGNGNNWTTNNISLTAGSTYDSMTDVPTLTSATAANTAVFNSIGLGSGGTWTVSNANLSVSNTGSGSYSIAQSTIAASGNKYYFEFTATNVGGGGNLDIGVMQGGYALGGSAPATSSIGQFANGYCYTSNGTVSNNNTNGSTYSSFAANDVIMVALDLVNNKVYFGKNGTWQNSGNPVAGTGYIYSVTAGDYFAAIGRASVSSQTGAATANFGQQPFTYTPPTGFVALNTYNLPTPTIVNGASYMAASTYTGNLTGQSITNGGNNTLGTTFQPDLVWIKSRSAATDHKLTDSVRGATKALISDTTGAETTDVTGLTAFNSNGFTLGASTVYNNTAATYVAWQWQAGAGSSSSNTNGSITSTVSVNATAGFSVVGYTGNATAGATVGHGLGVAPAMIIVKDRAAATSWAVYHKSVGATGYLLLNSTQATTTSSQEWNNTAPTSTVFTVGNSSSNSNQAAANIAYCWAAVAGFSAFGSYTGNGSTDGPFVYCGFKPRWIMIKRTDVSGDWEMMDTSRDLYNITGKQLFADLANAEFSGSVLDIVSNGFKFRDGSSAHNASGGSYIYATFAENPAKFALAR